MTVSQPQTRAFPARTCRVTARLPVTAHVRRQATAQRSSRIVRRFKEGEQGELGTKAGQAGRPQQQQTGQAVGGGASDTVKVHTHGFEDAVEEDKAKPAGALEQAEGRRREGADKVTGQAGILADFTQQPGVERGEPEAAKGVPLDSSRGTVGRAVGQVDQAQDTTKRGVDTVTSQAEGAARQAGEAGKDFVDTASEQVKGGIEGSEALMEEGRSRAVDAVDQAQEAADRFITQAESANVRAGEAGKEMVDMASEQIKKGIKDSGEILEEGRNMAEDVGDMVQDVTDRVTAEAETTVTRTVETSRSVAQNVVDQIRSAVQLGQSAIEDMAE